MMSSIQKKEQKQKKLVTKIKRRQINLKKNLYTEKAIETLKIRIDVKILGNKKQYVKGTSRPIYMSHKIFDNNLVAIRRNKVTLMFIKPAYVGMYVGIKSSINVRITV